MNYSSIKLKNEFEIERLVTFHYYEFSKEFIFTGERHDFWEFLYVDEGKVEVVSENNEYILSQGDIIFHKPNEFHSVCADRITSPNVIVICFICTSEAMAFFKDKVFSLGDDERDVLLQVIIEGKKNFSPPIDNPQINDLKRADDAAFGSENLIKNNLEILLIKLFRKGESGFHNTLSSVIKEKNESESVEKLIDYLEKNISKNFSLDELCHYMKMSKTRLSATFKKLKNMGVIEYFRKMKLQYAKKLIRDGNSTISEISNSLGYSSVHYFSRHFTKSEGCTPSEYAKSIKARLL